MCAENESQNSTRLRCFWYVSLVIFHLNCSKCIVGLWLVHTARDRGRCGTRNGTGTIGNNGPWSLSQTCVKISTQNYAFHLVPVPVPVVQWEYAMTPAPCTWSNYDLFTLHGTVTGTIRNNGPSPYISVNISTRYRTFHLVPVPRSCTGPVPVQCECAIRLLFDQGDAFVTPQRSAHDFERRHKNIARVKVD